jgi:hypothetical protein
MDAQALVAGLLGAGIGAAVCYWLVKRDWLGAVSALSIGAAALLGIVTEGNRPRAEHSAVFAASTSLILCFAVTLVIRARRLRKSSAAQD